MSERPVVLREAVDEDVPTLLRIMHVAFEEYVGRLDPPSAAHTETIAAIRKRLSEGSAVLALIDDEAVGFAFYQPQGSHLYFSRLSVMPAHRRRGIGRALIDYVEDRARERRFQGVRLGVRVQLPELKDRYERLGYQIVRYVAHEGHSAPTYMLMEKSVLHDP
jgi:ribosomal protein S18 acetylase RimI-like enzyme